MSLPLTLDGCLRPGAVVRRGGTEGPLADQKAVVRHTYLIAPVLTHSGHSGRWTHFLGNSKLHLAMQEYGGHGIKKRGLLGDLALPDAPG